MEESWYSKCQKLVPFAIEHEETNWKDVHHILSGTRVANCIVFGKSHLDYLIVGKWNLVAIKILLKMGHNILVGGHDILSYVWHNGTIETIRLVTQLSTSLEKMCLRQAEKCIYLVARREDSDVLRLMLSDKRFCPIYLEKIVEVSLRRNSRMTSTILESSLLTSSLVNNMLNYVFSLDYTRVLLSDPRLTEIQFSALYTSILADRTGEVTLLLIRDVLRLPLLDTTLALSMPYYHGSISQLIAQTGNNELVLAVLNHPNTKVHSYYTNIDAEILEAVASYTDNGDWIRMILSRGKISQDMFILVLREAVKKNRRVSVSTLLESEMAKVRGSKFRINLDTLPQQVRDKIDREILSMIDEQLA